MAVAEHDFSRVAVIGAAGQTGELFTRSLTNSGILVEAVVRKEEDRFKTAKLYPGVRIHPDISEMLGWEPDLIILATPNPANDALHEIAGSIKNPLTLVLTQNGRSVVSVAKTVLEEYSSRSKVTLIRAALMTMAARNTGGDLIDPPKKRIVLAVVPESEKPDRGELRNLQKSKDLFEKAGYKVEIEEDFRSLESYKLIANSVGSTGAVTGYPPFDTFMDPQLFAAELTKLKDELAILKAEGIKPPTVSWLKKPLLLARLPMVLSNFKFIRKLVAVAVASERNNQPPAAWRQIENGAKKVEATKEYNGTFIESGKKHDLESPVDEAVYEISKRHARNSGFSLTDLSPQERRRLLLEVFDLTSQKLYIPGNPGTRKILEAVFNFFTRSFEVSGKENLAGIESILSAGKSVLFMPDHDSHADHPAYVRALRETLTPEVFNKYPIHIVANMQFKNDPLTALLGGAHSHPVVHTLKEDDSEETRWKAAIVNRKSGRIIDKLLEEPAIWVVYPEGGRNKTNGKEILLPPAPGVSSWLRKPQFGSVIPVAILGTEKMFPVNAILPYHADLSVEYGRAIDGAWIRGEADKLKHELGNQPKEQRRRELDRQIASIVMDRIRELKAA